MKRRLIIGAIILPAMLLIAIATRSTPATAVRDQVTGLLESYLQYRAPDARSINSIQRLVSASLPLNFTAQMSKSTFGNGNYFKSNFHSATTPTDWLDQKPLPYPPVAMWCARLQSTDDRYPAIVFVAFHEDDYHGKWIVHDPSAAIATDLDQQLKSLGCGGVDGP
jgi:hypothetical protein